MTNDGDLLNSSDHRGETFHHAVNSQVNLQRPGPFSKIFECLMSWNFKKVCVDRTKLINWVATPPKKMFFDVFLGTS